MRSAPASANNPISRFELAKSGSPPMTNGMKAERFSSFNLENVLAIRVMAPKKAN
jgi:hypothetical protein